MGGTKSLCTILTSDSELIDSTYMVTPTSTGGPEIRIIGSFVVGKFQKLH